MEAITYSVPGQMVYSYIPASELRGFSDGLFSQLAVNPIADSAKGMHHRYMAGHDLLLDVPKTFASHGPSEAMNQAGHILLTDFTTKAGIPIPGFSHSGLGKYLEELGINRGWMQINICDAGVGILAISEASSDLMSAFQGTLEMSNAVFFDTYVEGSLYIGIAVIYKSSLPLLGGIENILAGIVATYKTHSVYIDPLDFFGAAGISSIIGFTLSYGLANGTRSDSIKDAVRSGVIGSLFSISSAFGFGALAGFASYRIGTQLAERHNRSLAACLSVNQQTYELLLEELVNGNSDIGQLLERTITCEVLSDDTKKLESKSIILPSTPTRLSDQFVTLEGEITTLQAEDFYLTERVNILDSDPMLLQNIYSDILKSSN